MTPEQIIATWKDKPLTGWAGAPAHFDELLALNPERAADAVR